MEVENTDDWGWETPKNKPKKGVTPKKTTSPREGPEGDSIMVSHKKKLMNANSNSSLKSAKKGKKSKTGSDISFDSNSSKKSAKHKLESQSSEGGEVSDSSPKRVKHTSGESVKTPASARRTLKAKKRAKEINSSVDSLSPSEDEDVSVLKPFKIQAPGPNDSWEEAVKKARGNPDGAIEGLQDHPKENGKGKSAEKNQKKKTPDGKKKDKPMKILQNAAQKVKGKINDARKGVKRKSDESTESEAKRKKIEEMTKKERKVMRKMQKTNYDLAMKTKQIWEEVRRHDTGSEKRTKLCTDLYNMVKDRAKEMILAHDTSRVVQCLVKYGTQDIRDKLFEELKGDILEMSMSKYAKFFVKKLLKFGTKPQRAAVFKSFHGNVRKLIRHREASEVVEYAYDQFATAPQRSSLVDEFYGPSFALFKTPEVRSLDQIMSSQKDKRETILRNMKDALIPCVDKEVCIHSIVHRVFLEFFTYAKEHMRQEMIETVRESLVHMLHTRDGARVAMHCIWYGTVKDRKVIIKTFKTYVGKICKEEYGHMVMLAIFDCVDDTKLVQKVLIEEMMKTSKELAFDQYGRKVLLYLLSPRDPLHFHPDILKVLAQGDKNTTSKKDSALRRKELRDAVSKPMLQLIVDHAKTLAMNNTTLLLILAILRHSQDDITEACFAISQIAAEPFTAGSLENFHIVEHPGGHMTLKKLVQNDAERVKSGEKVLFSSVLLDTLPDGCLKSWAACNRGCFMLLTLLELNNSEVTAKLKAELEPIMGSLSKVELKGAQILCSKLNAQ